MSFTLRYDKVVKEFQTKTEVVTALKSVSAEVNEGELFCLLGPSGCGKTTLLRCTAGLEQINGGHIYYGETDFSTIPPYRRNLGMVFQNYALYPHLTIFENIAYALRIRKISEEEIKRKVKDILALVGMEELMYRNPGELSGGQQQRVALARALVYNPKLLLLDEPLANLDAKLKVQMRGEIRRIQKASRVTAVYVTHDQQEAMAISDRLAIMEGGLIRQIGTPDEIYSNPANKFVAGFIGTMNFLQGKVIESNGSTLAIEIGNTAKKCKIKTGSPKPGDEITVALRPENMTIALRDDKNIYDSCFAGTVAVIQFLGKYIRYQILGENRKSEEMVQVDMDKRIKGIKEGSDVVVNFREEDALLFFDEEGIS